MDNPLGDLDFRPRPNSDRPLLGLTVLVVEDSRYTSEALRLLCLRSGARIRRADCVASAERHLNVYRPSVGIVDLGLPDGSGQDVIARMAAMEPRVPIILGTSGDDPDAAETMCRAAGADGFLRKPLDSLAAFQAAILEHVPGCVLHGTPRPVEADLIAPDSIAFREDLAHAMDLLALDDPPLGYLRRFLIGVARSAHDATLEAEATRLGDGLPAAARVAMRGELSNRIQALQVPV